MGKSAALLLVIAFLAASCIMAAKPAHASIEDSWVSKAPMHEARSGLGVAVVDGKIYAISGWNSTYSSKGTNEMYDPATDSWATKAPMPTPRSNFGIAVYQNKVYCIGGSTTEGATGANEVYDSETDTWENKAPMPTAKFGLDANVVDGKIYLIEGDTNGIFALSQVYDIAADTWSTKSMKAYLPLGFNGYASVVLDNRIYFIGSNNTQIYDPSTEKWSYGAPIPWYLGGSAAATTGVFAPKRVYVMGGGGVLPYPDNYVYDPEADVWDRVADMPTARGNVGIAVVDDVLYAIGGDSAWYFGVFGANEQYKPFGSGTVPPAVSVVFPENRTYASGWISLNFSVNKPASWIGYSIDGKDNVTVTGNVTLSGLSNGVHNMTVYVKDEFGNTGVSETVWFNIEVSTPPTALVAVAVGMVIAIFGFGFVFYLEKRGR
jgi:N-acetylneuraminic acid mutarotase